MNRTYELMFIVRPDMVDEELDKLISTLETAVSGSGGMVHELERRLRVTEPVIKFLTVRIDEEQKRLDKIKKIRESRKKAPPAPVTPAGEGTEAAPVTA